ncbi:MAG: hypothetical protein ABIH37_01035 [archaeon]
MEIRHVKIEYEEALSAKKEILSSQIDLLNIQKKMRDYKALRKKEFSLKNKLKSDFSSLKSKINTFTTTLPEDEPYLKASSKKKQKIIEKDQPKDIQKELEEIREKLSKLG